MRLIIQVVEQARVRIHSTEPNTPPIENAIGKGLLVYLAVGREDDQNPQLLPSKIQKMARKLTSLKLFATAEGKIEQSLQEIQGEVLLISNFTLYGDYKSGSKIDFSKSASFAFAQQAYEDCILALKNEEIKVETGVFGAEMQISSTVAGPINYIFDF